MLHLIFDSNLIRIWRAFTALLLLIIISISNALWADGNKVARVIIIRGEVKVISSDGKSSALLKKDDWLSEGSTVKTMDKSFVKLLFTDQTQLSVGPNGQMVINTFPKDKPGVVTLLEGQIRSTVSRSLGGEEKKESSKFYMQTKTAAMGVRGTDFEVIYNSQSQLTSLVTFSGTVSMAQVSEVDSNRSVVTNDGSANRERNQRNTYQALDQVINSDKAVQVSEGQYSGANPKQVQASIPTKISPAQLEGLKSNTEMSEAASSAQKRYRSPIPPGVSGKTFINDNKATIGQQVASTGVLSSGAKDLVTSKETSTSGVKNDSVTSAPPPEGFYDPKTKTFAPPAGGFVDLKTGFYVPPPPGSTFDPNTGVYIPPPMMGGIDPKTGNYLPPQGFKLAASGEFVAATTSGSGSTGSGNSNASNGTGTGSGKAGSTGAGASTSAGTESKGAGAGSSDAGAGAATGGTGALIPPPPPNMIIETGGAAIAFFSPDRQVISAGALNTMVNMAISAGRADSAVTSDTASKVQGVLEKATQDQANLILNTQQTNLNNITQGVITNSKQNANVQFSINPQQ